LARNWAVCGGLSQKKLVSCLSGPARQARLLFALLLLAYGMYIKSHTNSNPYMTDGVYVL
jgi:hypothetical protein